MNDRVKDLVHGGFLGTAWFVFAWPLSSAESAWAAASGGVAGALLAGLLGRWRLRLVVRLLVILASPAILEALAAGTEMWALPSRVLGPSAILGVADALRWFGWGLAGAGFLRTVSRLSSPWASGFGGLLEASALVAAVASTLFAHRDGMIARPLEVSDWFFSRNVDPVWAFTAVGAAAAVLAAGAWLRGRSFVQGLVALGLFAGFAALVASWGESFEETVHPDRAGKAKEAEEREKRAGARGGGRGPPPEEPTAEQLQSPQRRRPVAVVVFHKDVEPFGGVLYFRTASFSQFNGVRLVASTLPGVEPGHVTGPIGEEPVNLAYPPGDELREDVATDVALMMDAPVPPALVDPVRYESRPNPSPARFTRMIHVISRPVVTEAQALLGHDAGDAAWSPEVWQHYTRTPSDPRYLELAARLVQRLDHSYAEDPLARALVVRDYLEESATYSFRRNYDGASDPTAAFLFSDEMLGYCVHLSHSVAFLMRAMGIPSRVSVGYAVPLSRKGTGSAALLTSGDAHAWAEIYLAGVGWVPIEVVPEKTEVEPSEPAFDLQQLLGEMARDEGRFERHRPERWDLSWLRHTPWILPILAAGVLCVLTSGRVYRQLAPRLASPERRVGLTFRATMDALASLGFVRASGESWEQFSRRVSDRVPSFSALNDVFLRAALSRTKAPSRDRGPRLNALCRDVRVEARQAAGWRRFAAPFEVWCWLKVR
ncbi:MAG: transglutaminase family protein [Myxococcota bacterium]